jgi:hypothetical protein
VVAESATDKVHLKVTVLFTSNEKPTSVAKIAETSSSATKEAEAQAASNKADTTLTSDDAVDALADKLSSMSCTTDKNGNME